MAPKIEVTANDTPEVDDKTNVVAAKGKRKVKEEEQEEEEKPIVKKKRGVVVTTTKVAKPVVAEKTVKKNTNSGGAVASGSGSTGSGSGSTAHRLPVSPSLLKIGDILSPGEGQLDYTITQPEPIRNVDGDFHFKDEARFRPNVSPEEIIRQGSFGGGYWRVIKSKKTGVTYKNDWGDMPKSWYEGVNKGRNMTQMNYDMKVNKWGCKVGQTYDEWDDQGWFQVQHDSRGWFHWYCRYFVGRRCADDARQIDRWIKIASPKSGRWRRNLLGKYLKAGDTTISPTKEVLTKGIRQTLFHWAYDPTSEHLAAFIKEKS